MRYFFFLPSPEPPLACCVVKATTQCQAVTRPCSVQALFPSEFGALCDAVVVSMITATTDKDLATAAGTEVVAGTGQHRHEKADEGWIYTCLGVTLAQAVRRHGLGVASVLTAKSRLTLCPSHQPFPHTAITAPCHLFLRQRNSTAVLRFGHLGTPRKTMTGLALKPTRGNYPRFYSGTYRVGQRTEVEQFIQTWL